MRRSTHNYLWFIFTSVVAVMLVPLSAQAVITKCNKPADCPANSTCYVSPFNITQVPNYRFDFNLGVCVKNADAKQGTFDTSSFQKCSFTDPHVSTNNCAEGTECMAPMTGGNICTYFLSCNDQVTEKGNTQYEVNCGDIEYGGSCKTDADCPVGTLTLKDVGICSYRQPDTSAQYCVSKSLFSDIDKQKVDQETTKKKYATQEEAAKALDNAKVSYGQAKEYIEQDYQNKVNAAHTVYDQEKAAATTEVDKQTAFEKYNAALKFAADEKTDRLQNLEAVYAEATQKIQAQEYFDISEIIAAGKAEKKKLELDAFNTTPEQPQQFKPIQARLEIPIPDLHFTDPSQVEKVTDANGNVAYAVPYIGQYIAGIFRYGIGALAVISVLAVIVAGAIWSMAGGNKSQIDLAKDIIFRSLMALLIILGSYSILYIIDPDLTELQSINVTAIKREEFTLGAPVDAYVDFVKQNPQYAQETVPQGSAPVSTGNGAPSDLFATYGQQILGQ